MINFIPQNVINRQKKTKNSNSTITTHNIRIDHEVV